MRASISNPLSVWWTMTTWWSQWPIGFSMANFSQSAVKLRPYCPESGREGKAKGMEERIRNGSPAKRVIWELETIGTLSSWWWGNGGEKSLLILSYLISQWNVRISRLRSKGHIIGVHDFFPTSEYEPLWRNRSDLRPSPLSRIRERILRAWPVHHFDRPMEVSICRYIITQICDFWETAPKSTESWTPNIGSSVLATHSICGWQKGNPSATGSEVHMPLLKKGVDLLVWVGNFNEEIISLLVASRLIAIWGTAEQRIL